MSAPPVALEAQGAALDAAERDPARVADALSRALEVWRALPVPALADVVERLTPPSPPIKWVRGKEEAHRQWLDLAADYAPARVGPLLEALTARLPIVSERYGILDEGYTARKVRPLHERLAALGRWPADPRVATRLVALLAEGAYSGWGVEAPRIIYGPAVELIEAIGDTRAADALARLAARPTAKTAGVRDWCAATLPAVAARLRALRPPQTPPALAAILDGRAPAPTRTAGDDGRSEEALLAEIVARPDDDAPRAVYADLLTERGDPRGELIALQLALTRGEGNAAAAMRRVGSLTKRHAKEWLGALAPVAKNARWARGFLDSLELAQNAAATADGWADAARAPALATVRRLGRGRANEQLYLRFVSSPEARALVDVEVPSSAFLDALAELPIGARVTRLRCHRLTAAMSERLATPVFPSLRTLELPTTMAAAAKSAARLSTARPALDRLDLAISDGTDRSWATESAALLRAVLEATTLGAATIRRYRGACIGARRTAGGGLEPLLDGLADHYDLEAADDLLAALGLSRASVRA